MNPNGWRKCLVFVWLFSSKSAGNSKLECICILSWIKPSFVQFSRANVRALAIRRTKQSLKQLPNLKSTWVLEFGKMSELTAVICKLLRQLIQSNKYLTIWKLLRRYFATQQASTDKSTRLAVILNCKMLTAIYL